MEYIELALKRPYPVSELQWRKGFKGGKDLVYIDARQVANRLDKIVGMFNWQDSYTETGSGMKICTISILYKGNWISKSDGAGDTGIEGEKGSISDAFKRCAARGWGIGRYLYFRGAFDANRIPAEWATPEGYDRIMAEINQKDIEQWKREYENAQKNG